MKRQAAGIFSSKPVRAFIGLSVVASLVFGVQTIVSAAPTATLPLKVNFGTQTSPTPAGYVTDYGQAFDTARGYGWTNRAGAPLSLVGNGRDRDVDPDQRLDTLMNMALKAGSPGVSTPGQWKAAVPNGAYDVTVAAGDASYTDSIHRIQVEGVMAIDFKPTATAKFATKTVTVNVTDGFIDVDPFTGDNTKINYVDIVPSAPVTPPTTTPPTTVLPTTTPPTTAPPTTVPPTTTPPTTVPPVTEPSKKFDFAPANSTSAAGYTLDSGKGFDAVRGYGWETLSGAPLDLSSETRKRSKLSDVRLDTFVHMQSGRAADGRWQLVVPNGTYKLTFGLGDADYNDSLDLVRAEGLVVGRFQPEVNSRTQILSSNVDVHDGKLTIDAIGGLNTKIGFIDVEPVPVATAPTGVSPLTVSTPQEYLGLGKNVVFSTVKGMETPAQAIYLKNTSDIGLTVSGITFSGPQANSFALFKDQPSTFRIGQGTTERVDLKFFPTAIEVNSATMTITTADNNAPITVNLSGMNARDFEDVNEPSLQAIFDSLGYGVNAGVTNEWSNFISKANTAVGDEVLTANFTQLDKTKPVNFYPLAEYTGRSQYALGPVGPTTKGTTSTAPGYNAFYTPGGTEFYSMQNQKLLPQMTAGYSSTWNNPSAVFGVRSGANFSDDAKNAGGAHNTRIYPAKTRDGAVIPGSYLVATDEGSSGDSAKNYDYQEMVFLVTNVTPAK